jgi:hypothetical protein
MIRSSDRSPDGVSQDRAGRDIVSQVEQDGDVGAETSQRRDELRLSRVSVDDIRLVAPDGLAKLNRGEEPRCDRCDRIGPFRIGRSPRVSPGPSESHNRDAGFG